MTDLFGQYRSQETRALQQINSSKYVDINEPMEVKLRRHDAFIDYISQYLQVMQKGVDQANQDAFARSKDILSNFVVLLGGGTIADINFGDLQYFLPALGALFGLDQDVPFPINLFHAAEKFFLGYVVPLDSFGDVLIDVILGWLSAFGINQDFLDAIRDFLEEVNEIWGSIYEILETVLNLFDVFGFSTDGFGPFADLWHVVSQLLGGVGLETLGNLTDPIFATLAPWVQTLATFVSYLSSIMKAFSGGFVSVTGLLNLAKLFNPLNLLDPNFGPSGGWAQLINVFFLPLNLLLGPNSPLAASNIFGFLKTLNLPFLPIGMLTNDTGPNVLSSPNFDAAADMQLATGWIWDGTRTRTTAGGSARAKAGGYVREMLSQEIPVSAGQKVETEVYVQWSGLVYTGFNPITMSISRYLNGVKVGETLLSTVANPAAAQPTWLLFKPGTYVIPAGCDVVRLSFKVGANATAGNTWFDDASFKFVSDGLPQSWVAGLQAALDGITDFVKAVVRGILNAIGLFPIFGPGISDFLEELINGVTGWFNDTEATAAVASDAKMGVQATQDIIVSGIAGSDQSDVDDTQVEQAINSQTAIITQQGAALDALQSSINGSNNSGKSILDDFEYVTTDLQLTGNWTKFVISGIDPKICTPDGHNANVNSDGEVMYRNNIETDTNFQRVTATIAGQLVYPGFGDGRRPRQAVYCRVSQDGTKWVRMFWVNTQKFVVDYRNGSSNGILYDSGEFTGNDAPGPGSSITIEPGVGVDVGKYRIYKGGSPLRIVDDSINHVTDWTQKGVGIGFFQDAGYSAGAYTQFTASDNAPSSVQGIGFRAFASGASAPGVSAGNSVFPANTIDTVKDIGANMEWNQTTQTLKIKTEGWYLFGVKASVSSSNRHALLWEVVDGANTLRDRFGPTGLTESGSGSNRSYGNPVSFVGGLPLHYAKKDSLWRPGVYTSSGSSINGDASGIDTVFSAALLNRSTA